jgi:hypothetical protein
MVYEGPCCGVGGIMYNKMKKVIAFFVFLLSTVGIMLSVLTIPVSAQDSCNGCWWIPIIRIAEEVETCVVVAVIQGDQVGHKLNSLNT